MCGITGIVDFKRNYDKNKVRELLFKQNKVLSHRGPNSEGIWLDDDVNVGFAHKRLSIVDLSVSGHQPMKSSCGRYIITYNGELYNADDLRHELIKNGAVFKGHSDTEVFLESFVFFGLNKTLELVNGMFAFALWDCLDKTIVLGRDRLGIKPIYWTIFKNVLIFGSELKSLLANPDFPRSLSRNSVASYLKYNYVPTPDTVFENTYKLPPGHLLVFKSDLKPVIKRYWSLDFKEKEIGNRDEREISNEFQVLFDDAVKRQMVSDVPIGTFLSGGVDSSAIVAAMQKHSSDKINTYTIGFNENDYNEAKYAKNIARHLNTNHTELYLSSKEALNVIPLLPMLYDEPFSDSSQIATYLISKLASKSVSVVLTGDGGDEVFQGYNRYLFAEKFIKYIYKQPKKIRHLESSLLNSISPYIWDSIFKYLPISNKPSQIGNKVSKVANILRAEPELYYQRLVTHWPDSTNIVYGSSNSQYDQKLIADDNVNELSKFMRYMDINTYLHDDILTKVDRATMGVSLEARVPYLDHRLVEYAWKLPENMLMKKNMGKLILRKYLYKYVPKDFIERPKTGFSVPIGKWLNEDLRDWAEDLLEPKKIKEQGIFNENYINQIWDEHKKNKNNWENKLWSLLVFQSWQNEWLKEK